MLWHEKKIGEAGWSERNNKLLNLNILSILDRTLDETSSWCFQRPRQSSGHNGLVEDPAFGTQSLSIVSGSYELKEVQATRFQYPQMLATLQPAEVPTVHRCLFVLHQSLQLHLSCKDLGIVVNHRFFSCDGIRWFLHRMGH